MERKQQGGGRAGRLTSIESLVLAMTLMAGTGVSAQTLPYWGTTTSSNTDGSAFKVVNNTATPGSTHAFRGEANNGLGTATGVYASGNFGVQAVAVPGFGAGLYAHCSATGTTACYGVWAQTLAGTGDAGIAGMFETEMGTGLSASSGKGRAIAAVANSTGAIGVSTSSVSGIALKATTVSGAASQFTSQSGTYPAILATNSGGAAVIHASSTNGFGGDAVYATSATGDGVEANCSGWNCQNGVYGFTANPYASCVIGQSSSSVQGYGVVGRSWGVGKAVYGELVSAQLGGYAGYFQGNTHVNGMLSKLSGTFKIDHPQDPANKFLVHSFVESPEMKNVYDGVVVLDSTGAAAIQLPSYFESLNTDFRYQLTAIGGPATPFVRREVSGNSFEIAGGSAGQKISWQVTGVRKDAWAKAHPVVVEQAKAANERGKYLVPELVSPTAQPLVQRPAEPNTRQVQPE